MCRCCARRIAHARIVSIDTSRGGGDGRRRRRHHLRRCAGRGRLRRVRQRPADHGARQGALCRRGGGGGRCRRPAHRQARAWRRSRWSTSRCRRCSIRTRRCGRARRCCTTTRRTTSPSISRSASATSRRALPNPIWWSRRIIRRRPIEHAYLEPEAGLAYVDHDGVVTMVSPDQNITHHRHMLARIIAKPISKVRFIMSPVGGGFGGKEDMIYQGMLALLAMKTRRPVRLVFTREESIVADRQAPSLAHHAAHGPDARRPHPRLADDDDLRRRRLRPVDRRRHAQGGDPRRRALRHSERRVDTYGIYTNNTPSGAFRSFGALQTQFATETPSRHLRRAARARSVRNPPHQRDARRRHRPTPSRSSAR